MLKRGNSSKKPSTVVENQSNSWKKPSKVRENQSNSSKEPLKVEENLTVEQEKSVPKPGKLGKEIDDIFAGKKRKKPELEKAEKKVNGDVNGEGSREIPMNKKKKTKKDVEKGRRGGKSAGSGDPSSRPRKRTEDGLVVYTEEELGINKANAGSTPLCPFDCDCCF